MVEVALGGMPWKFRSSRWQPTSASTAQAVVLSEATAEAVILSEAKDRPGFARSFAALRMTGLRQREDIEHPAFGCRLGQILHRVHEAQRRARVSDIESARHYRSGPAAHPGQHRDVV